MNTITLLDMLKEMETGAVFSLTLIRYDRKRKTGGQVVTYDEARLYQPAQKSTSSVNAHRMAAIKTSRRPNHGQWFTRNIQLLQDGYPIDMIRKIHPPLVVTFNGKTLAG